MIRFDETAVRATYRYLHHARLGVTEIRVIAPDRTVIGVGYFDSEDAFVSTCAAHNGRANLYAGIQPRPRPFLARNPNRLRPSRTGAQDRDIKWLTTLVIDIDPVRPKNSASTRDELTLAERRATQIADWMASRHFQRPVRNMSGNGVQLWFAIPPHPISRDEFDAITFRVKYFEHRIRQRFSGDGVKIDSIYNLSRIIKVIGTQSIKGDNSAHRPYRVSKPLNNFVRVEDARLLHAIQSVPIGQPTKRPRATHIASFHDRWLQVLIKVDTRLRELFYGNGKTDVSPDGKPLDTTSSGYDYSLALELARLGITDPSPLASTLVTRPDGHARAKGQSYIERTVALALKRIQERSQLSNERPTISLTNRDIVDLANDAWQALTRQSGEYQIYRRSASLIQLCQNHQELAVQEMTSKKLHHILCHAAKWVTSNEGQPRYTVPPCTLVEFMMNGKVPDSIPEVQRITAVPYYDNDENLVLRPGYRKREQTLLLPWARTDDSAPYELDQAKKVLHQCFLQYFHFVHDTDIAHLVALLLTPFAHAGLQYPAPLFVMEAPTTGSGKSILIRAIATILCGTPNVLELLEISQHNITRALSQMPCLLWLPDVDELNQRALWRALSARAQPIGGPLGRPPAHQPLWLASGENPTLSPQVARRSICIRLAAPHASPWLHSSCRGSQVLRACMDNRAQLIRALLSLWSHWFAQGRRRTQQLIGSFEDWCETLGGVLACSDYRGFLTHSPYGEQVVHDMWAAFFDIWWRRFSDSPVYTAQLLCMCQEFQLHDIVAAEGSRRSQQTRLGLALHKQRNRVIGDKQLSIVADTQKGRTQYRLQRLSSLDKM